MTTPSSQNRPQNIQPNRRTDILNTVEKILSAQQQSGGKKIPTTIKIEIEEQDPVFSASAAAKLVEKDVEFLKMLPQWILKIFKTPGAQGAKGDKGDTVVGAKGDKGADGKDGKDGLDANANPEEIKQIAGALVTKHEKKFDHELIHDPRMIGTKMVDMSTLVDNGVLTFDKERDVWVCRLPAKMEQKNFFVASQGVSNVRSISVTQSRELDDMGIYVVDATAGNITIALPTAAGRENYWFEIIRIDSSSNTVTITPNGSETMSGMTDYGMQQWTDVKLFAYAGNYLLRDAS